MIRHIVVARFNPSVSRTEVEQIVSDLRKLPEKIGDIVSFEVGLDQWQMQPERSADLGIVSSFADLESLERYQADPAHVAVAKRLRAVSQQLTVVDYDLAS